MQTATIKPTIPSAKTILAAQHEAKRNKREARNINLIARCQSGKLNLDRNKQSSLINNRLKHIESIKSSDPISQDDYLNCSISMWLHFSEMRHVKNPDAIDFVQRIIRQYQILACLYDQSNRRSTLVACEEAYQALDNWLIKFDSLSPNQRDIVLHPIWILFSAVDYSLQTMPTAVFAYITNYANAVGIMKKSIKFAEIEPDLLGAFDDLLKGENSFELAKKYKAKYAYFANTMLYAANLVYEIGLPYYPDMNRPLKISEIRQDGIKKLCDHTGKIIINITREAEIVAQRIEEKTGVSFFDWADYTNRMANLGKTKAA